MNKPVPLQWYRSQANLIWPDGTWYYYPEIRITVKFYYHVTSKSD